MGMFWIASRAGSIVTRAQEDPTSPSGCILLFTVTCFYFVFIGVSVGCAMMLHGITTWVYFILVRKFDQLLL